MEFPNSRKHINILRRSVLATAVAATVASSVAVAQERRVVLEPLPWKKS